MEDLALIDLLILAVLILLGIGGLFMTSAGGGLYGLGLAVFVVAVVLGFYMIKRHFDRFEFRPALNVRNRLGPAPVPPIFR